MTQIKNIGALIAGVLTIIICAIMMDILIGRLGFFPKNPANAPFSFWLLNIAHRNIFQIIGAMVCVKIMLKNSKWPIYALAAIGFVFSGLGILHSLNRGPEFGPIWYPISLWILSIPSIYIGARLVRKDF